MDPDRDKPGPWHKNPYVWLVISMPAAAVIGGIITLIIAVATDDGLVVDDYYKRGLEINKVLVRERAAQSHGLMARISISDDQRQISLALSANDAFSYPGMLRLTLAHATRGGLDQNLSLVRTGDTVYQGSIEPLARGGWYAQIEADDWRLMERIAVP